MISEDIKFINSNINALKKCFGYPRDRIAIAFEWYLTDIVYDRLCR